MADNIVRNLMQGVYSTRLRAGIERTIEHINARASEIDSADSRGMLNLIGALDLLTEHLEDGRVVSFYEQLAQGVLKSGKYDVSVRADYQTIGEAIKDFRKQAGISNSALAEICKVSTQTIVALEKNYSRSRGLRRDVRERIMGVFSVNPPEKYNFVYGLPVNVNKL